MLFLIFKFVLILVLLVMLFLFRVNRKHPKIEIYEGKGKGQVRYIKSYDPETKTIKLQKPFAIMPDATSRFKTWR